MFRKLFNSTDSTPYPGEDVIAQDRDGQTTEGTYVDDSLITPDKTKRKLSDFTGWLPNPLGILELDL